MVIHNKYGESNDFHASEEYISSNRHIYTTHIALWVVHNMSNPKIINLHQWPLPLWKRNVMIYENVILINSIVKCW